MFLQRRTDNAACKRISAINQSINSPI